MSQREEIIVRRINYIFGKSLIDQNLLDRYKQLVGKQLTSQIKKLLVKKLKNKVSDGLENITQLIDQIAYLSGKDTENLREKLGSSKKTVITKNLARILIPNKKNRREFQKLRQKMVEDMRENTQIKKSHVQMFQLFYQIFNPQKAIELEILKNKEDHTTEKQQNQLLSIDKSDHKLLKTLLTSIKKLTGIQSKSSQYNENPRHAYQLSKDIKAVIQKVCESIKQVAVAQKLQQLLEKYKSGNRWFGPRISKIIENQNWCYRQIMVLIQSLKTIKITQRDVVTKLLQVNKAKKKIIQNLKKYGKKIKGNNLDKQQFDAKNRESLEYISSERMIQSAELAKESQVSIMLEKSSQKSNKKYKQNKRTKQSIEKIEKKRNLNEIYDRDHQLIQLMLFSDEDYQVKNNWGREQIQKPMGSEQKKTINEDDLNVKRLKEKQKKALKIEQKIYKNEQEDNSCCDVHQDYE